MGIFGVAPEGVELRKDICSVIAFTTLLERRLILFQRKRADPPTHSIWIKKVMSYIQLEKIKYMIRGSKRKFQDIWSPLF